MITELFANVLYLIVKVITYPLVSLPDVSLDSNFVNTIHYIINSYHAMSFIIDLNTLFICIALIILIDNYVLIYKLINWLIRKIPGMS